MDHFKVSRDTEVTLNGEKYLLEEGDEIVVVGRRGAKLLEEGVMSTLSKAFSYAKNLGGKLSDLLSDPKIKKEMSEKVDAALHKHFGTNDLEKASAQIARKYNPKSMKKLGTTLGKILPDPSEAVSEGVISEDPTSEAVELMWALLNTLLASGGVAVVLALWLRGYSPVDAINWILAKFQKDDKKNKRKKK